VHETGPLLWPSYIGVAARRCWRHLGEIGAGARAGREREHTPAAYAFHLHLLLLLLLLLLLRCCRRSQCYFDRLRVRLVVLHHLKKQGTAASACIALRSRCQYWLRFPPAPANVPARRTVPWLASRNAAASTVHRILAQARVCCAASCASGGFG
jgi:hypothetical protein